MLSFFKYIVCFVFCFNITAVNAAEVIADFDEVLPAELEAFGRADLPDATQMQSILYGEDTNELGRIILLGKYFDAKYPNDLINNDFSDDVAAIFPELSQQEVYDRTNYIRHAVNLYRWGTNKYNDIKAKLAVPEEPPLIADDDEYDDPKKYTYIETEPDKVAVVYDFKKVLTYGSNPRDLKAIEAKKQREAESKQHKTGFDKFKSMASKLEFAKLPFYGISLPNPFVGNAGVGEWLYGGGFKARLISELAEINSSDKFLGAIHVGIPQHRFMLATSLSEHLQKPRIIFEEMQNIKSYKVYNPTPINVLNDKIVGGYAGDLAFPIEFETLEPNKPIKLKAKIVFNSCDNNLNCELADFLPELQIENGEENKTSGMQNFIRQTFYNLPQDNNNNLILKSHSLTIDKNSGNVSQLQFVFAFKGKISNFAIFLEDENYTAFTRPAVTVNDNLIYVTTEPLTNADKLLNKEITITARLNNYTAITQKATLTTGEPDLDFSNLSLPVALRFCLFAGLLFAFMPAGLGFLLLILSKTDYNKLQPVIYGIVAGANIMAALAVIFYGADFVWGNQYASFAYLSVLTAGTAAILSGLKYSDLLPNKYTSSVLLATGIMLSFYLPIFGTAYTARIAAYFTAANHWYQLLAANFAAFVIALPYIILLIISKISPKTVLPQKAKKVALTLGVFLLLICFIVAAGRIILQLSGWQIVKFTLALAVVWLLFDYLFRFLQALAQVSVPQKQKEVARKVIGGLFALITIAFALITSHLKSLPKQVANAYNEKALTDYIATGHNVLVAITPEWCFTCKVNSFLTFNKRNFERWKTDYKLVYMTVDANNTAQVGYLLRRYHQTGLPLYILFNYQFENGIILSPSVDETSFQQFLTDF